jgi:hypothetical protein
VKDLLSQAADWFERNPDKAGLIVLGLAAYHGYRALKAIGWYYDLKHMAADLQREASEALGG